MINHGLSEIWGYCPNNSHNIVRIWYLNGTPPIQQPFGIYSSRVGISPRKPWDLSSKNTVTNTPFRTGMEKPSTISGFFSKNNGGFRAWNLESGLLKWVPVETQQVSRFQMQFPFLHDLYVSLTRCEYAQPNHLQVNMSEP